jgi:7-keto-8-aminopelargonate synthetase-like enzyme
MGDDDPPMRQAWVSVVQGGGDVAVWRRASASSTATAADATRIRGVSARLINMMGIRTERLRLIPTPLHSDTDIDELVAAVIDVWETLILRNAA